VRTILTTDDIVEALRAMLAKATFNYRSRL